MGLIKAAVQSVSGALSDQWKEYFYCEAMTSDILVQKGRKKKRAASPRTKATTTLSHKVRG